MYLVAVEAAPAGRETVAVAALMTTNRLGISLGTGLGGAFIAIGAAVSGSATVGLAATFAFAAACGLIAVALTRRM